jgi:hypothetical protein
LSLSAALDVFQAGNELIGMAELDVPRFDVRTLARGPHDNSCQLHGR